MPGTTQHSSADWLNREDGKSVALWCALVSTACVCVNNPLNGMNMVIFAYAKEISTPALLKSRINFFCSGESMPALSEKKVVCLSKQNKIHA